MKLFGTDGVRGKFGYEPILPHTIVDLGYAIGVTLRKRNSKNNNEVVIGKDTRLSGYLLESALTAGLLSAGVNVALLGPVPTPAVSYFCRMLKTAAGIVVSASHNPVEDNGIKLLSGSGSKFPASLEHEIEELMSSRTSHTLTKKPGKARRIDAAVEIYAAHVFANAAGRLNELKLVVDCANGASYRLAPTVLTQLGANVVSVADQPNGNNINRNCGSTTPEFIQKCTKQHKADVGIALDGDGDRVILVDEKGNLVNGDQILYILAKARKRDGKLKGGVVGTHVSNSGLPQALAKLNIPFERVNVGDRFIAESLKKLKWNLGGEECGHILHGEVGTPGDGLIAALEVLNEMINSESTLSELTEDIKLVPQKSCNVRLSSLNFPINSFNLDDWPLTKAAVSEAQQKLNSKGRIYLRASGTEPAIRILVEGEDYESIQQIAKQLTKIIQKESSHLNLKS